MMPWQPRAGVPKLVVKQRIQGPQLKRPVRRRAQLATVGARLQLERLTMVAQQPELGQRHQRMVKQQRPQR